MQLVDILTELLEENVSAIRTIFTNDETVIFRNFGNRETADLHCCAIFIDAMIEREFIDESIIKSIMSASFITGSSAERINVLAETIIVSCDVKKTAYVNEIVMSIISGDTVLLVDGAAEALIINTREMKIRPISESPSEGVVRGPRDGFTEAININLTLIRRRIKTPALKFKFREIGVRTRTKICVCYIEGIASDKILTELNKRLDSIEIDGILDSGYIQEMIKDAPLSPFKTVGNTERPDIVAAKLLEGRIAIVCDGTPSVLTLPFLYAEYFQSNEDYYNNFIFASTNRMLRYIGFFITTTVPPVYLALVTYHQEMIPTPLLLSIAATRKGVPFPTVIELLTMLLVFEILREAGTRLPTPIGQAISIAGSLVIGEAGVNAKLVSAPMVMITALTGVTSFLLPKMLSPIIIIRITFTVLAGFMGLYGHLFGVMGLYLHLSSLRSFGVPYMLNTGSIKFQDIKDTSIRAPWWMMYLRPKFIATNSKRLQSK